MKLTYYSEKFMSYHLMEETIESLFYVSQLKKYDSLWLKTLDSLGSTTLDADQ